MDCWYESKRFVVYRLSLLIFIRFSAESYHRPGNTRCQGKSIISVGPIPSCSKFGTPFYSNIWITLGRGARVRAIGNRSTMTTFQLVLALIESYRPRFHHAAPHLPWQTAGRSFLPSRYRGGGIENLFFPECPTRLTTYVIWSCWTFALFRFFV